MEAVSGAEMLVRMLEAHGVDTLFGLCGDTSLPFYDALARSGGTIRHVLTRDERSAAYMADGYARVSGRVGVCEGPSGGGATYILPGVVEANESSIPLLALTTDIATTSRGRYTLTELDQAALFRPLTKWNAVVNAAADLPRLVRTAFAQMTTGRTGAVHLGIPFDVQKQAVEQPDLQADASLGRYPARRTVADPAEVERAAKVLRGAARPLLVCGGGVLLSGAEAALMRVAEALGAPVATTISGQGSIAENHPLAVGVVGSNGGVPATRRVVEQADCVFFVTCRAGSVTTERWRFPARGATRVVQLDVDPNVVGANYAVDAALVGDARLTLDALADALGASRPGWGREAAGTARAAKWHDFAAPARSDERPIRPERLVAEVQRVLDADAIVVADPGTPCPYFSAYYELRATGRHFISNRAHGALGYAMSAAVGAHYAGAGGKIVAVMGDGSFGFTCGELETIVRHRVPLTMIVVSNASYGWIKAGQRAGFGERYYSVDFSRTDHAAVAAAFGVKSWRVEAPGELGAVLAQAVAAGEPTLVDVVCQGLHEARAPVSEWVA
jgi:acetolactate synthase-1/2/3 large subunit